MRKRGQIAATWIHHGISSRKLVEPTTDKTKKIACKTILCKFHKPQDGSTNPSCIQEWISFENGFCSINAGHGYGRYIKK
jgi:hypothetical protein